MAHANIRDVAVLAGVAVSTVSVVLNEVEGARVSDTTRRKVHEAAEALGYTPNAHARNLRAGKTGSIALITDRITTSPYGVGILEGAQQEAWRHDVTLLALTTEGDHGRERSAVRYASSLRCQGIIFATAQYEHRQVPTASGLVVANCQPAGSGGPPHVVPDERRCGVESVQALLAEGHRRIAAIVPDSPAGLLRLDGITVALAEAGLEPSALIRTNSWDATADGGDAATDQVLSEHPETSALLCFSDRLAMGAYRRAARRGRRIPEDLTVVGSDDIEPVAESLDPGLTTWAAPNVEMGEWAVQVCLDRSHPAWTSRAALFPRPLIRRGSTAAPGSTAEPASTSGGRMRR